MKTNNETNLCILGIGDSGLKPMELLYDNSIHAKYVGVGQMAIKDKAIQIIHFNSPKKEFIPGVKRFLVPDMSVEAELPGAVTELIAQDYHFLLMAGLGGFTGTKFTMSIVRQLIEAGKDFTCIVSFPFRFEGRRRINNASLFADEFATHPSMHIVRLDDLSRNRNLLLRQAFDFADISLVKVANKELRLGLKITFPEVIKQTMESRNRLEQLRKLAKEINNTPE